MKSVAQYLLTLQLIILSSVMSKQLVWSAAVVTQEVYDDAVATVRDILYDRKVFQLQRSFLNYAALHRAQCLSGIGHHFGRVSISIRIGLGQGEDRVRIG